MNRLKNGFFVVVADKREMPSIRNSIYTIFAPLIEEREGIAGKIENSGGLEYKFINFDSERRPEAGWKSRVFKRVLKDRNLYRRDDAKRLEVYVKDMFS